MATKLKNLKIRKVDFVDEGANPGARIGMFKRKDGEGQAIEEENKKEPGSILKKLFGLIGKAAGMDQSEIDRAVDEVQKGSSMSFTERINAVNTGKIADEMWDICYALQSSLCSILNDEEMDSGSAATAMQESLDEFYTVVQDSIKEWSGGKLASIVRKSEAVSEEDLKIMKSAVERLNESIEKAGQDMGSKRELEEDKTKNRKSQKGDKEEMKIDKSKLSDAERAFLESIEKRYGTEGGDNPDSTVTAAAPAVAFAAQPPASAESEVRKTIQVQVKEASALQTAESDNIYKGLHPAVAAEMEELRKFRQAAEEKELNRIAKKYALIGKKEEELVPLLKSLKAAGGTAYNDMIAILDQTVEAVEKSGVFSEIGKSGNSVSGENSAQAKISGIAKGYMEKDTAMSYQEAVAKAWEDHPELLAEYDEQEGF